jgi:long-chain acyl-CoA synthetase
MTSAPTVPAAFAWGTRVARSAGRPVPFLQYEPRRHRLPELLEDAARWAGRNHLVQGGRRVSFERFLAAVEAVSGRIAGAGLPPGGRVLILAANSPEWVVSLWAALHAGAVVAPGNGWWSEEEVEHAVRLTDPVLVIGDGKRLAKLPPGCATLEIEHVRALVDAAPPQPAGDVGAASASHEDDPALIVFTSGTTGLPKGATLAHRSLIANLHNLLAVSGRLPQDIPADRPGHVSLLTGPLFHIGGLQAMSLALVTGGTLVFLEGRFDAGQVLDVIERERVSVWGAVPTMALRVLDDPTLPGRDLSSVRSISLGGAPVPPELIARLHTAFPNARKGVSTVYGMTETGGTVASASGALMAEHPGTAGRAVPVAEIRIADPDPAGIGEILVRTPGQMLGYWGEDGVDTIGDDVIDGDGFVHTGDLGRLDDDGLLYITGRCKDVIIRGGENIAAPRVEAVLLEHPAVASVAVVGRPHPDLGEEVAAAVVAKRDGALDAAGLAAFAAGRLAHFEVPTQWWLHPGPLPANDAGKVDKRRLLAAWPDS